MSQELIKQVEAFYKGKQKTELIAEIAKSVTLHHQQSALIDSLSKRLVATIAVADAAIESLRSDGRAIPHELAESYMAVTANAQSKIAKQNREHIQQSISVGITEQRKAEGRKGSDKVHNAPDGSRAKKARAQAIWAEGNFISRDRCAEQECDELKVTFKTFRDYLTGTPDPKPWPAKEREQLANQQAKGKMK